LNEEIPLISIITPSLNQGAYIEDNIKSVMNQNYPNFEHIIIDGGSTDGTIDILKKYSHLTWVSEKDGGQSEAINKGIRRAKGEIIGWLNSDDYYQPGAFLAIVQKLSKAENTYIVFGDCKLVDEKGKEIGYCSGKLTHPNNFIKYWPREYRIPQPAVFFYKDIIDKIGFLDENFHYVMDYDFWLRISKQYRLYYVEKPFAIMRVHNRAKSNLSYELFEREWFKILRKHSASLGYINYIKYIFMAQNFRSHLFRISAYSKMDNLSEKEFRKKILFSIAVCPFNLFKPKFFSAMLRAIVGHQYCNRIKRLLTSVLFPK